MATHRGVVVHVSVHCSHTHTHTHRVPSYQHSHLNFFPLFAHFLKWCDDLRRSKENTLSFSQVLSHWIWCGAQCTCGWRYHNPSTSARSVRMEIQFCSGLWSVGVGRSVGRCDSLHYDNSCAPSTICGANGDGDKLYKSFIWRDEHDNCGPCAHTPGEQRHLISVLRVQLCAVVRICSWMSILAARPQNTQSRVSVSWRVGKSAFVNLAMVATKTENVNSRRWNEFVFNSNCVIIAARWLFAVDAPHFRCRRAPSQFRRTESVPPHTASGIFHWILCVHKWVRWMMVLSAAIDDRSFHLILSFLFSSSLSRKKWRFFLFSFRVFLWRFVCFAVDGEPKLCASINHLGWIFVWAPSHYITNEWAAVRCNGTLSCICAAIKANLWFFATKARETRRSTNGRHCFGHDVELLPSIPEISPIPRKTTGRRLRLQ